jgi:hypothetical protein
MSFFLSGCRCGTHISLLCRAGDNSHHGLFWSRCPEPALPSSLANERFQSRRLQYCKDAAVLGKAYETARRLYQECKNVWPGCIIVPFCSVEINMIEKKKNIRALCISWS